MTTVAFLADLHLGNLRRFGGPTVGGVNRRCRHVLDALEAAVALIAARGADALVVCGDVFDTSRPAPQVIAAAQGVLAELKCRKYLIVGNHDLESLQPGDHALGPMAAAGDVEVVAGTAAVVRRVGGVELVMVPFTPGKAPDTIRASLVAGTRAAGPVSAQMPGLVPRVLCVHAGVRRPEDRAPWMLEADDALSSSELQRIAREVGARAAVAGNWHTMRKRDTSAHYADGGVDWLQVGALAPTGWDNSGMDGYGHVGFFGTGGRVNGLHVEGPVRAGPRFLDNKDGALVPQVERARELGYAPYARCVAESVAEFESGRSWIAHAKEGGLIVDGEAVLPPSKPSADGRYPAAGVDKLDASRVASLAEEFVRKARRDAGAAWPYGGEDEVVDATTSCLAAGAK